MTTPNLIPIADPEINITLVIHQTEERRRDLAELSDPDPVEEVPPPGEPPGAAPVGARPPAPDGGKTLEDVIGRRPAVVLVRLVRDGDSVATADGTAAVRPTLRKALKDSAAFVGHRFREGRANFDRLDEWEELLGGLPAPAARRLALLTRLARPADEPVARGDGSPFTPGNDGRDLYADKFAAFPDGTPFSIGLLFDETGRRGNKSADPRLANHPWKKFPKSLRLLAIRHALRRERAEGHARTDNDLRALLLDALRELGVPLGEALFTRQVSDLRTDLTKAGVDKLFFPESKLRQQQYDHGKGAP